VLDGTSKAFLSSTDAFPRSPTTNVITFSETLPGMPVTKKKALALFMLFVYETLSPVDSEQSEEEAPIDQCKRRLDEMVLKEKIILTTERLGKMVGNLVSRIYTHDAQKFGRDIVDDVFHSWNLKIKRSHYMYLAPNASKRDEFKL